MNDKDLELSLVSWLSLRGYLITKVDVVDVEVVSTERPLEAPVSRFNDFWALYPRKVGKEAARKIFEKKDLATQADIIAGLQAHLDGNAFSNEKNYIKHPSTWLTQQVWKDEPEKRSFPKDWTKPQIGGKTDSRKALDAFLEES